MKKVLKGIGLLAIAIMFPVMAFVLTTDSIGTASANRGCCGYRNYSHHRYYYPYRHYNNYFRGCGSYFSGCGNYGGCGSCGGYNWNW